MRYSLVKYIKNHALAILLIMLLLLLTMLLVFTLKNSKNVSEAIKMNLFHDLSPESSVHELNGLLRDVNENSNILVNLATISFTPEYINNSQKLEKYLDSMNPLMSQIMSNVDLAQGVWLQVNPAIALDDSSFCNWHHYQNGKVIKHPKEYRKLNEAEDPYYFQAIKNKKPVWTDIYQDTDIKIPMMTYGVPLCKNGTLIGVTGIDISLEKINELLKSIGNKYKGSKFYLVNKDFKIISSFPYKEELFNKNLLNYDQNLKFLKKKFNSDKNYGNFDYKDGFSYKIAVISELSNQTYLVASIPTNVVYKNFNFLILSSCIMFGLLVLCSVYAVFSRQRVFGINRALKDQTSLLEGLLDSIPDLIFLKDIEGKYIGCNPAFAEFIGLPKDQILGKIDYDLVPKEVADLFRKNDKIMMELGKPKSNEEWISYADGRHILVDTLKAPLYDSNGNIIGLIGVSRDITEKSALQKSILEKQSQLKAILDNMPFLAWLKDKDGVFIIVNEVFSDACGKLASEIIGKTDFDVWSEELAKTYVADDLKVINSGVPVSVEEQIATPEGIEWFETFKTPIFDKDGKIVGTTGLARNITERKIFEQELMLKDKLLLAVAQAANELLKNPDFDSAILKVLSSIGNAARVSRVYIFKNSYDSESDRYFTGQLYEWAHESVSSEIDNPKLQNISFDEISPFVSLMLEKKPVLKHVKDFDPNFREILESQNIKSLMIAPIYVQDHFWGFVGFDECKEERIWSEAEQSILSSFAALLAGVIERNEKQQKIQESLNMIQEKDALQRLIMESTENGYILFSKEGKIILVNNMFFEMFELAEEARNIEIGSEMRTLVSEKMTDSETFIENTRRIFQTLDKVKDIYKLKNGKIIERYTLPLFVNGEHIGRLCNFRDITQIKKIEKLKNEFISTVSHELRTPLTSIRGALGLVRNELTGKVSDATLSLMDIANNNSIRLVSLINDILDIEKIEAGKMEFRYRTYELMDIVYQAIDENTPYGKQYNVNFAVDMAVPGAKINVDKERLKQVITNLFSNAVKFSPQGSTVSVSVSRYNKTLRVSVKDSGSGIPKEFQSRIFEKFVQADSSDTRSKGGTGLGLSISRIIVEKMGGNIGFTSEANVGTTFYFDLPEIQVSTLNIANQKNAGHKGQILICEDDPDIASLISAILEKERYKADIAESAEQAKQMLAKNKYDLITLDLILPDQDGLGLVKELKNSETLKDIPVIVISVQNHEFMNESEENPGIFDWIVKPIDTNRLLGSIECALADPLKPNILHVEDNPNVSKVVAAILAAIANVTSVTNLKTAKNVIEQELFDLVILDAELPDGNGLDLLPFLNQNSENNILKVVFSDYYIDEAASKSVDAVLLKTSTTNEKLLNTIQSLLQKNDKGE